MEKLANVQIPGNMPAKKSQRQTTAAEPKDDFIRLMQQKTESPAQPETKKTKDDKESVKVPEETTEPVEEVKPETEEELTPQEELQQMELLQALLQQTAVQMAEPETELTGQNMQPETVEPVLTEAVVQAKPEAVIQEAESVREAKPQTMPAVAEEAKVQTAATENPVKPETEIVQPEKSSRQEQTALDSAPKETTVKMPEKAPVEREQTFTPEMTRADVGMAQQPMTQAESPVHAPRTEDVLQHGYRPEENTVQSTMEKLPQELGKALSRNGLGESNTLTVELEPASLGKLTIQLVYNAGRTAVSVMATNPRTLELLNEKATEIAAILRERTGEETVILTQETQRQPEEEAQQQNSGQGGQQERQQHREEKQEHAESFMQQLRLGLV